MRAKDWGFNTSKTSEVVTLLDLIVNLRKKSYDINQEKIHICVDNREKQRRIDSTTKVINHFNKNSAAEMKAIKRIMKETCTDAMLKKLAHEEIR